MEQWHRVGDRGIVHEAGVLVKWTLAHVELEVFPLQTISAVEPGRCSPVGSICEGCEVVGGKVQTLFGDGMVEIGFRVVCVRFIVVEALPGRRWTLWLIRSGGCLALFDMRLSHLWPRRNGDEALLVMAIDHLRIRHTEVVC